MVRKIIGSTEALYICLNGGIDVFTFESVFLQFGSIISSKLGMVMEWKDVTPMQNSCFPEAVSLANLA